ncbi:MAG: DUF2970 domain-containing protein [Pseudomonadota bacterium]
MSYVGIEQAIVNNDLSLHPQQKSAGESEDETEAAALQRKSRQGAQANATHTGHRAALTVDDADTATVDGRGASEGKIVEACADTYDHERKLYPAESSDLSTPSTPSALSASTSSAFSTSTTSTFSTSSTPTTSASEDAEKGLSFVQLIGSALAAAIGVQSSQNRKRDFKKGRIGTFVATGIIFTVLFIATVLTVVSFVLGSRS